MMPVTLIQVENNCEVVFQKISDHLSSSYLATARIFENWMQFFKLKCSTRDKFLGFFSSAKSILHKLKTANSVAVMDDTFIRAYLAKTIEAPELQQEVKQFILSSEGDYASILDKVFKDTWMVPEFVLRQFRSFYLRVARYLTKRHIQQLPDGTWGCPATKEILEEARLFPLMSTSKVGSPWYINL